MRRSKPLRPDNFPFLAVLLCAMGALILVLMALDRRARLAAQNRVHETWKKQQQEEADRLAKHLATHQARQEAAQEAERQAREARMARHERETGELRLQQEKLKADYDRILAEMAAAERALAEQRNQASELKARRGTEEAKTAQAAKDIAERQARVASVAQQLQATRTESQRLAGQLRQLELALARLKEQRERDRKTFSVVPYVGKRGLNSRPLYVECTGHGIVFHPDRVVVSSSAYSEEAIREQIRGRMEKHLQQMAGNADEQQAYWMLLVRPDGIENYYRFLAAARPLEITYGYEFVEPGWALEFPDPATVPVAQGPAVPLRIGPQLPGGGTSQGQSGGAGGGSYVPGGRVGQGQSGGAAGGAYAPGGGVSQGQTGGAGGGSFVPGGGVGQGHSGGVGGGPFVPGGGRVGQGLSGGVGGGPFVPGGGRVGQGESGGAGGGPVVPGGGRVGQGESGGAGGGPNASSGVVGQGQIGGVGGGPAPRNGVGQGQSGGSGGSPVTPRARVDQGQRDDDNSASGHPIVASSGTRTPGAPASAVRVKPLFEPGTAPGNPDGPARGGEAAPIRVLEPRGLPDVPGSEATPPVKGGSPASSSTGGTAHAQGSGSPASSSGNPGSMSTTAGAATSESGGERSRLADPPDRRRKPEPPPPLRPAPRFDDEWVMMVECTADGVRLSPSGVFIPLAQLYSGGGGDRLLLQTVMASLERRKSFVRAGDPPLKAYIRFVVQREGLRAFHLAYPALITVPAEKSTVVPAE